MTCATNTTCCGGCGVPVRGDRNIQQEGADGEQPLLEVAGIDPDCCRGACDPFGCPRCT